MSDAALPRSLGVLHFYPGDKRVVWLVRGKPPLTAEAWGGEEVPEGKKFGQMRPHRTTSGRFIIHSYAPYVTKTWVAARIRWGTRLRVEGTGDNKIVLYQTGTSHRAWRRVDTLIPMGNFALIHKWYGDLYGTSRLYDPDGDGIPDRWVFNEFGPMAVRYFRDRNHNRQLDGEEHLMGELLHTVPTNEAETAISDADPANPKALKYTISHGCIHVSPKDRDRLFSSGAFRRGTTFIVHRYDERMPVAPPPRVQLPEVPEPPPTQTRYARLVPERTFLDFVVLDPQGKPLKGRRYKLELPDGQVETGRLGSDARIERRNIEQGTARFRLLLDEAEAAAAEGSAVAALAEPDEAEPDEAAEADQGLDLETALAPDLVGFRLIDDDDKPVAGTAVTFTLADGSVREGVTDSDGKILLAAVPPGDCQATIMGVDDDLRPV